MDIINPLIIFFVGLVVSVLGTLIGGSSLFTIPTLILLGLSPHSAIGTDRFGIMGICSAGWYKFHQKRLINYRVGLTLAVPVFFGAFIGANLVFEVSESVLKLIIIIISLFSLAFLIVDPTRGIQSTARCIGKFEYLVGGAMTFVVGIYVVQIIYVLTVLVNGIENGTDKTMERASLGNNLIKSTITYSVLALGVILLFNIVAVTLVQLN